MYCLLCHEKIPRIRYWRTKSEFCCDEHAAIHRRQTMERLVGPQALPADGVFPGREPADAGQGEPFDAPPLPADAFETERTPAAREWLQPEAEQTAAQEVEPAAAGLEESAAAWDAAWDEESPAEDVADGRPYLQSGAIQRDEPFPVEVRPTGIETRVVQPDDLAEPPGPLSPRDSGPNTESFLDLLSRESSKVRHSEEERETEPVATSDLMDVLLRASGDPAAADLDNQETVSSESFSAEERSVETPRASERPPEAAQQRPSEVRAGAPSHEEQSLAKPQPEPAAAPTVPEAAPDAEPAAPKAARPVPKGFGLKPVRAWDPTKAPALSSGKKTPVARGPAGPGETGRDLGQLADGLSERAAGARPTDPRAEAARQGRRKPVLVCFLPVQGGNGASTVSLHVAEAISHHLNERVLLADFDFHSGTLAFRLGLKPTHTLGDVFEWRQEKDQTWENAVCPWNKLDVLVAPSSNNAIHPQSLERLPEIFASALRRYPYVIVDHPDAIYSSSRHIFKLADLVYLVCTPEITSLHLARRKVQQIRAMGVPGERLRLIVNRAGSWGSLGVQDIGKIVGVPVSWALNNDYAALRDAVWNGGLVQEGSALAQQLRELGWSIMGVDAPVAAEAAAPSEVGSPAG